MIGEIGVGTVIALWFGSLEFRVRNFVGKDRFNDLKDQTNRIETKVDALLTHNNIDPSGADDKE